MKKHQMHSCIVLKALKSSPEFSLKLFLADRTVFGGGWTKPKKQHNKKVCS